MIEKKYPIHTYYIGHAKADFEEISDQTNDVSEEFPKDYKKVSQELTRFIVENIFGCSLKDIKIPESSSGHALPLRKKL